MDFWVALITIALLAAVIYIVSAPLRAARGASRLEAARRQDLEAAREAKYREIRDAELDYRTGKLSKADYETIDASLRAEALEILNNLEALGSELVVDDEREPGDLFPAGSEPSRSAERHLGEEPEGHPEHHPNPLLEGEHTVSTRRRGS
jgi:hypothetical protein